MLCPLKVSDHALLRYIERKKLLRGNPVLDIAQLRAEVLPTDAAMLAAIDSLGDGEYGVADSHRIRLVGRVVVTVLPYKDDAPPPRAAQLHFTNQKRKRK